MSCECYRIGGPFIAEDPDCPIHGYEAQAREKEERAYRESEEEKQNELLTRIIALEEKIDAMPQCTQPAPSIPDGWLRAIDEALVVAHIGVANESDAYEEAKAKLNSLICFHVDVATDPAVNGGWKLVPIEPTETFYQCFSAYDGTSYSNPFDYDDFVKDWSEALAAALADKP